MYLPKRYFSGLSERRKTQRKKELKEGKHKEKKNWKNGQKSLGRNQEHTNLFPRTKELKLVVPNTFWNGKRSSLRHQDCLLIPRPQAFL
jgi:hypothetical protein